ncbi:MULTISPECIES: diguanylate cyclase [Citrobacter]|uniref:diguanylate cyclase n=1 Tax=Citrobacter TaxID=544 RepID=UPI0019078542|nr:MULTISPECIES: diguanylate cyclase [Citrobacter]MBJ9119196.1 diguanylate cyclase [Citrobacter koseri]MDM3065041.1 diguanylate cyclase [Citrobacter sp. CK180]HEM6714716.1 diguanylate cyclase [Citrobacter koseri]
MIKKTIEIDTILLDLNQSIDAHYQWLVKMFRCTVSGDVNQPDIFDINSHCLCQFSQWLNNHPVHEPEEKGFVIKIIIAHEHMHTRGRELLRAIAEKRSEDHHFDSFQEALLAFTSAVMDYKIYLLNIRSNMDILTGLPGRRVLDESFERQLIDAQPLNLYLLLFDIDRFKLVNDNYGHLVGDSVLRTLASNLSVWTRYDETPYRYGGEEFVIIIRTKTDEQACRAGLRICQLVADNPINYPDGELSITVTAGITLAQQGEPLDVVIGRADRAMYRGKQTGRNRCMFMDKDQQITRV